MRMRTVFFVAVWLVGSALAVAQAQAAPLYAPQGDASLVRNRELCTLLEWLDRQSGVIIAMQRELVSRPAVNPEQGGTGEDAKLYWVESWLREHGVVDIERLDYTDARVPSKVRGNLIARVGGGTGAARGRTLWLPSHLDVAAPGDGANWKGDPFRLRVEGDLMYGRGTEDNHQAIVSSLLLVDALRVNRIAPPMAIGLLFCSGALTGYDMNIGHVLRLRPDLFAPGDLILLMDYGSAQGNLIEVAEKSNMWFRITVTGREGHGSSPHESTNAFAVGAELVHELRGLSDVFPARNPLFTPPESTFSVTRAENFSSGANHIPGKFAFYLDARIQPEYSHEAVRRAVRELADDVARREGAEIDVVVVEETPSTQPTPSDAPVVRTLGRAIEAQLGVKAEVGGIGGVTMASPLRARGLSVAAWGIQKNWRNRAEEHASIRSHLEQAKVLARVLYDPAMTEEMRENKDAGNARR